MGQLIGPGIQSPIGQVLLFIDHPYRLGGLLGLRLKELMDTAPLGIGGLGLVPLHHDSLPLGLRQER
jgi:hypothetical protein